MYMCHSGSQHLGFTHISNGVFESSLQEPDRLPKRIHSRCHVVRVIFLGADRAYKVRIVVRLEGTPLLDGCWASRSGDT